MHTVQLLLKTSKYERHEIDRRFHALAHLHNVCVKHVRKCMILQCSQTTIDFMAFVFRCF